MKAKEVVNAATTLLCGMDVTERHNLSHILGDGRLTEGARHKAIASICAKSINRQVAQKRVANADFLSDILKGAVGVGY